MPNQFDFTFDEILDFAVIYQIRKHSYVYDTQIAHILTEEDLKCPVVYYVVFPETCFPAFYLDMAIIPAQNTDDFAKEFSERLSLYGPSLN